MKKIKQLRSFLVIASILITIIAIASAFNHFKANPKPRTDWTDYYWFSPNGTYLRQNIVDDEIELTDLDEFAYAPFTLHERGYAPADVVGYPPIPLDPYNPTKRLYSHP